MAWWGGAHGGVLLLDGGCLSVGSSPNGRGSVLPVVSKKAVASVEHRASEEKGPFLRRSVRVLLWPAGPTGASKGCGQSAVFRCGADGKRRLCCRV